MFNILFGTGLTLNKKIACLFISINPKYYEKIREMKNKKESKNNDS